MNVAVIRMRFPCIYRRSELPRKSLVRKALTLQSISRIWAISIAAWDEGKFDVAAPLLRRALDIRRERFGSGHISVAESLNNLSVLERRLGEYESAEALQKEANSIWENLSGNTDLSLASGLNNLGELY